MRSTMAGKASSPSTSCSQPATGASKLLQTASIVLFVVVIPLLFGYLFANYHPSSRLYSSSNEIVHFTILRQNSNFSVEAPGNSVSVETLLRASRQHFKNPELARLVSLTGKEIYSASDLESEVLALTSQERFMFQPRYVGFTLDVTVIDQDFESDALEYNISLTTLSISPRVFLVDGLLTNEEIDYFVQKGGEGMFQSKVGEPTDSVSQEGSYYSEYRRSQQQWFGAITHNYDRGFERLQRRASILARTPFDLVEDIQVLRYEPGGHYYTHYDWIDSNSVPDNPYYANGGNRFLTILVYLSEVEEGGQTIFPKTNSSQHEFTEEQKCADDFECLKVYPKKGQAVFWYNLLEDGHMNGITHTTSWV